MRKLENLELVIKKTINTGLQGRHSSQNTGGGLEFKDYRQYQFGDDYRYIDWNLYSRLGKLFLKQFTEDREIIVYFLIDKSKSMNFGNPEKLDYAVKIAAALGYIALTQLDRVGCCFFDNKLAEEMKPGRGKNRVYEFFDFLSRIEVGRETNINQSVSEFIHKYKRPGLVLLISDFLDAKGYQTALKKLRKNKWNVFLLHTLARNELEPELGGEVYLIDQEKNRGKEIVINSETIESYQEKLEKFCSDILNFSNKYGISYFKIVNDIDIEDIVFNTFRQKGGVR